ncbi:hypothetical protein D3C73_1277470 [compost metagenome]
MDLDITSLLIIFFNSSISVLITSTKRNSWENLINIDNSNSTSEYVECILESVFNNSLPSEVSTKHFT